MKKYKSVEVSWYDGKKATIKAPKDGWLDYLIRNYRNGDYKWGYVAKDAYPFYLTNVYPDKVMELAREEFELLKSRPVS